MRTIAYFYLTLSGIACIFFVSYIWKGSRRYEKKFKEYMKGDIEDYFEVKYIKKQYLILILICLPLGLLTMHFTLGDMETSSLNWWGATLIGIALLTIPSIYYIYKSREKVIYDHGEIKYCKGNKVKVSGSIYDINKDHSCIFNTAQGASTAISRITFYSGDYFLFQRDSMDHGYKLEALMIKKQLFTDYAAKAMAELKEEYGEDEYFIEFEKSLRRYDEDDN